MEVNIICWKVNDKIKLNGISHVFKDVSKENEETYFSKLDSKLLKIVLSTSNSKQFEERYFNLVHDNKLIIIVNELNLDNIETINRFLSEKHCIVFAGVNKLNNKDEILKKVIIAPQLYYEEVFDIGSFLLTVNSFYKNGKLDLENLFKSNIIVGNKNDYDGLGEIPLFLLKRFKYLNIEQCSELDLNLYLSKELNQQDITYIEDPLKEYLPYNCVLKITQTIVKQEIRKTYISLISK